MERKEKMDEILRKDGLSLKLLDMLSLKSSLTTSLKKDLKYFNKEELLNDIFYICEQYDSIAFIQEIATDCRVKSFQSTKLKYERYYPDHQARKVFDDLLGFRVLCNDYNEVLKFDKIEHIRIADLSNGKSIDDGYRGVHVYYQKSNHHYPIEIQFNTYYDRQLNNWLHKYVYKRNNEPIIGALIRKAYEEAEIRNETEFKEVFSRVLSRC